MTKWFLAFVVFIGVFMTTRELMSSVDSSGGFQDFYIELKNDLFEDIGIITEVLDRDQYAIGRMNRVLVLDLSNNENNSTPGPGCFCCHTLYHSLPKKFKQRTSSRKFYQCYCHTTKF